MAVSARHDILSFRSTEKVEINDFLNSFERDIEDAIFETIETNDNPEPMFYARLQARKEPKNIHISHFRDNFISNENDPSQRLSVFAKQKTAHAKKPLASQLLLTFAVCSVVLALLLPALWFISAKFGGLTPPDDAILTGSIDLTGPISEAENIGDDPVKSVILDMPKPEKAANEGHVVRIDRGVSAGSIIYVNPN